MNININSGNLKNLSSIIKGEILKSQPEKGVELLKLLSGDVFRGKIVDIINSNVQISVDDGQIINARMAESMDFNIGDKVTFIVKENNGSQISIRPLQLENVSPEIVTKALESAELPMTERNIEIVKSLVEQKMPIDKQTINNIANHLNVNKESNIQSVVILNKLNIPITKENIVAFNELLSNDFNISNKVENVINDIQGYIESNANSPELPQIVSKMVSDINLGEQNNLPIKPELKEYIQKAIESPELNIKDKEILKETINQNTLDIKKFVESDFSNKIFLNKMLFSKEFLSSLKEFVKEKWLIQPEKFNQQSVDRPQEIKDIYKSVYEGVERIIKNVKNSDTKAGEAILNTLSNMKSSISFMNSFSHVIPYVQIPIKMENQDKNGELYIYNKNPKKQFKENEELKAFLHLDMEYLGATDVDIRMKGKKVSTNFTLDNDESMMIVEKYLPELKEKLEKRGYEASYAVEVIGEKTGDSKALDNIINTVPGNVSVKRYTFDIRA